jgi:hypothetical protein
MRWQRLRWTALAYSAGLALHTADHFRRGLDVVTPAVLWAGNVSTVVGLAAVALVLVHHRAAPLVAACTGLPIALGVAAVHLLPSWGVLSDAFLDGPRGVTAFSWFVVSLEIGGALAMASVGYAIVRSASSEVRPV